VEKRIAKHYVMLFGQKKQHNNNKTARAPNNRGPMLFMHQTLNFIATQVLLKGIAGDDFSGVILYDPLPQFAVKTALWLLKPGTETRDWTRSRVLAFGAFGSLVRIPKLIKNNCFLPFENTVCVIRQ